MVVKESEKRFSSVASKHHLLEIGGVLRINAKSTLELAQQLSAIKVLIAYNKQLATTAPLV
jgi:hypothetical protein